MELSKLVNATVDKTEHEETKKSWQESLPSKQEDMKMSRAEKAELRKQRQANLEKQMKIARQNVIRREQYNKQTANARRKAKITREISCETSFGSLF